MLFGLCKINGLLLLLLLLLKNNLHIKTGFVSASMVLFTWYIYIIAFTVLMPKLSPQQKRVSFFKPTYKVYVIIFASVLMKPGKILSTWNAVVYVQYATDFVHD
jgi:hypothetical protein